MKLVIYNATENSPVGWSWAAGAQLHKARGYFQYVVPARDWAQTLHEVVAIAQKRRIDEIQFWGHGSPGAVYVAGEPLTFKHDVLMTALGRALAPHAFVWFRTCASFAGVPGQALAASLVRLLNCSVAGSTHDIGFPWHSGQRILRPGALPSWSLSEGLDGRGTPLKSSKSAPATVSFMAMRLPDRW